MIKHICLGCNEMLLVFRKAFLVRFSRLNPGSYLKAGGDVQSVFYGYQVPPQRAQPLRTMIHRGYLEEIVQCKNKA